jgi:vacuolar iron transporter family protein
VRLASSSDSCANRRRVAIRLTAPARGLDAELARQIAEQLTARDALAAHARDELSISAVTAGRPLQAAIASALTFAVGAALPLIAVLLTPQRQVAWGVILSSLLFLALLGVLGARAGGASIGKSVLRVVSWGALAMAVTAGVGAIFGATV